MKKEKRPALSGARAVASAVVLLVVSSFGAYADEAADAVMHTVYNRPEPASMSAELTMTLIDSKGKERKRELVQISASFPGVDKKIMEFAAPADVKGTAFMNWSYAETGKGDDQWIYLPALKRVRRISSDGKGDSFMGSDFSYDDLGVRHPDRDVHTIIGSEKVGDEECWIVESVPKEKDSQYSKTVSWISKQSPMGLKREFYDAKRKLLKVLTVVKTETQAGYELITSTEMKNVQKNHRTTMVFGNVAIDQNVSEDSFTERALMRGIK